MDEVRCKYNIEIRVARTGGPNYDHAPVETSSPPPSRPSDEHHGVCTYVEEAKGCTLESKRRSYCSHTDTGGPFIVVFKNKAGEA